MTFIGQTISHYTILEKLGEGGMGVVYRAHDNSLNRTVALKFLPHYLTNDPSEKERFYNEARAAASLNHANIAVIHEIGEHDTQIFIVMECVEGRTLRDIIRNETPSIKQVLDFATQIADGLSAAHEQGVVHRDIKPENIIVTPKGQAKITDFGLAKLKGATKLTRTGLTLGTAAYMSPEQARGETVDHRADIFSLGVVIYEMLAGHLPFRGDHPAALIYSIANEPPVPLARYSEKVTDEIQHIVSKTLEKDREDRYQQANELLSDLRRERKKLEYALLDVTAGSTAPAKTLSPRRRSMVFAAGIIAFILLTLAIVFNPFKQRTGQTQAVSAGGKSIAVLPFVDLSQEKDQSYFCDGMTETLINRLGSVRELKVPARTSVFKFKGSEGSIQEIGQALQVQTVLEGSVQKSGTRLRISTQLINVDDGYQLWSQAYDRELRDVFMIQDEISSAIVAALKLSLTPAERRKISERPIDNIVAYENYLKAREKIWQFSASALDSAIRYLENGIAIVGDNPLLYSGMALAYWQYVNVGAGQENEIAKAEGYARKALALDPGFSTANEVLASIYKDFLGNPREAIRHYRMALADNPNELTALQKLAYTYVVTIGKPDAAKELIERALQLDPMDPWRHLVQGMQLFFEGGYRLVIEPFHAFHGADSTNPLAQFLYAWALVLNGKRAEGFAIIDEGRKTTPDNVCTKFGLLLKHGLQKDREQALSVITPDFHKTCKRDPEWSYYVGLMLSLGGAKTEALDWLENAVSRGFWNYPELRRNSYLDSIRAEERFKKLMERVRQAWEGFE